MNGCKVTQVSKNYDVDATQWQTMANNGKQWLLNGLRMLSMYILMGGKVWTITDPDIISIYEHHLCIQLDAFKTQMDSPVKMYVDWVKIYQATK